MTQNIYLVNDATDEVYYISNLNNLNWSIDTPVTPMPLPEDTHEENILVKMEGNTAKIDISWTLDEGAYFGTLNSSNVFTAVGGSLSSVNQIKKFKEFVPKSIGDGYSIRVIEDGVEIMRDNGTISNMSFNITGGSPIVWNVNCAFYVGNVVALLDADIPNAPTSVTLVGSTSTSANQGTISFTYSPYDGYATTPTGSSAPNKIRIKYKIENGTWEDNDQNISSLGGTATARTGSLTGLPHGNYRVKIAEMNGFSADAGQEYYATGATTTSETVVVG